jgi:hypothetical protein
LAGLASFNQAVSSSHSGHFCSSARLVMLTVLGKKKPRLCQTIPAFLTILALIAYLDVLNDTDIPGEWYK